MTISLQKILGKLNINVDLSDKLTGDILWNFVSFGIIAINGIILNILIVSIYGSSALGLFNQIYAVFIVLSQLAVNGIHFSVLKSVSLEDRQPELSRLFSSALMTTGIVSLVVIGITFPLVNQASNIFQSEFMNTGIILTLPGLFFFSLNKVILAFLNGKRKMKTFAAFQGLRSVFMVAFLLLHSWLIHNGNSLSIIFSLSEGLLFLTLLPFVYRNLSLHFDKAYLQNAIQHFKFGLKATSGNILLELNTKVDVLILGLFVSDREVGIYSFAALFIEGFVQLPTIIRNNINPILAAKYHNGTRGDFKEFLKKVIRYSYMVFIPLGIIGMIAFPVVGLVKTDFPITIAWLYFAIMLVGLISASGFLPLLMTFNQAGKPGIQSLVQVFIFLVLVMCVLIFTNLFGTVGAAVGVSFSYLIQVIIIGLFIRKILVQ